MNLQIDLRKSNASDDAVGGVWGLLGGKKKINMDRDFRTSMTLKKLYGIKLVNQPINVESIRSQSVTSAQA